MGCQPHLVFVTKFQQNLQLHRGLKYNYVPPGILEIRKGIEESVLQEDTSLVQISGAPVPWTITHETKSSS